MPLFRDFLGLFSIRVTVDLGGPATPSASGGASGTNRIVAAELVTCSATGEKDKEILTDVAKTVLDQIASPMTRQIGCDHPGISRVEWQNTCGNCYEEEVSPLRYHG